MKLRLDKENIKVRLTDWDLEKLVSQQSVSEEVNLSENNYFTFSVQISNQPESMLVQIENRKFVVTVSEAVIEKWLDSNQVGIRESVKTKDGRSVEIVVEKDLPPRKMKSKT